MILILIVFCFTFITMVGGNPQNDAYGFRYWHTPGAFAESVDTGALGRFHGFMGSLSSAVFTVVGPEYLSMVAGEAKNPRRVLKAAFKTVYWRFGFFFIGGALCVGVILPYSEPKLDNAGAGTADGSPYVIAMQNMGIGVLPHIVNALLCTSIFSAGNAYVYCSTRCLCKKFLPRNVTWLRVCSPSPRRARSPGSSAGIPEEMSEEWHSHLLLRKSSELLLFCARARWWPAVPSCGAPPTTTGPTISPTNPSWYYRVSWANI